MIPIPKNMKTNNSTAPKKIKTMIITATVLNKDAKTVQGKCLLASKKEFLIISRNFKSECANSGKA
jgi:hypothetical protein